MPQVKFDPTAFNALRLAVSQSYAKKIQAAKDRKSDDYATALEASRNERLWTIGQVEQLAIRHNLLDEVDTNPVETFSIDEDDLDWMVDRWGKELGDE